MLVKVLIDNISNNELLCEWGLSVYIEYKDKKILLDGGTTGAFAKNAKMLGIDLSVVDFGVISHAHYDHADGIAAFLGRTTMRRSICGKVPRRTVLNRKDRVINTLESGRDFWRNTRTVSDMWKEISLHRKEFI